MSVASAVRSGRRAAEARMLDTFEIRMPNGDGWTYDPVTQTEVEGFDVLFTTKGRVKASGNVVRTVEAGGRTVAVTTRELSIPVDSPLIPAGAHAVCMAVDPVSDQTLLAATLHFAGPAPGSQTTARRLEISEVLS